MKLISLTTEELSCYLQSSRLAEVPNQRIVWRNCSRCIHLKRSKVVPRHWACCLEKHENCGYHYHHALKLSGTKRWLEAKKSIEAEHGIAVNFSDHDSC